MEKWETRLFIKSHYKLMVCTFFFPPHLIALSIHLLEEVHSRRLKKEIYCSEFSKMEEKSVLEVIAGLISIQI